VPLTAQDVAEITRLLEESQFDELHIEHEGLKLTLRRGAAAGHAAAPTPAPAAPPERAPAVMPPATARPARGPTAAPPAPGSSAASTADPALLEITSSLVGIFYRAPKPGAPPYIEVGSTVQPDTIIGIIEVMKLMNIVRAEAAGTVSEILVADGAAVEYGQVLARVTPGAQRG